MTIFSIYKATNKINGKIYIGFDSNWPKRRIAHKLNSLNKKHTAYNHILQKAIRKYGWDAFEWEVLAEHYDSNYTLTILEPYFIDVYQSFGKNGYNATEGGIGCLGYKHTTKTKQKLKFPKSKVTKIKMSIAKKGIPKSQEHKNNMSLSNAKSKKCLLIDPEGNIHTIINIRKFCKDNPQYRLNYNSLIQYIRWNRPYKEWKLTNTL